MDTPDEPMTIPFGRPAGGSVVAPASKSHAIRILVCAALSPGVTTIRNLPPAADVTGAVAALRVLGLRIDEDGPVVRVQGEGGRIPRPVATLDVGGSATAMRFLAAVAALGPGPTTLTGDSSLRRRPMDPTVASLRDLGVSVKAACGPDCMTPPLIVAGGPPRRDRVSVDASESSHPLSALLLVGPALPGGLGIRPRGAVASRPYVDLTIWTMARFGARVLPEGGAFRVSPGGYGASAGVSVVGDWSSAAFVLAAGAVSGGDVCVTGLEFESPQADRRIVELLKTYGATVERTAEGVRVRGGERRAFDVDLRDAPDLAPLVGALGCVAQGTTRVRGAAHLRLKESDRIATVVAAARSLGCVANAHSDGFDVTGRAPHGGIVVTEHDHRIAMAFAVAGLAVPEVVIDDSACVAKSWPGFWEALRGLVA